MSTRTVSVGLPVPSPLSAPSFVATSLLGPLAAEVVAAVGVDLTDCCSGDVADAFSPAATGAETVEIALAGEPAPSTEDSFQSRSSIRTTPSTVNFRRKASAAPSVVKPNSISAQVLSIV